MNLEQARRLLQVTKEDDITVIKRKYHRLIGAYHPDAIGSERVEYVGRAQEINEAYRLLKEHNGTLEPTKGRTVWQGIVNEKACCDRNIYVYYSMEAVEEQLYYQAARGKYMWDPVEEEFELFLASIHHATKELLDHVEEKAAGTWCGELVPETEKFVFQAQLFSCLAMQFIDPVKTLHRLASPNEIDEQGREIYHFRAFLGGRGIGESWKTLSELKPGDFVYPASFQGNKIVVEDRQKRSLGYLSLEDDQLYFCIVPLLKKRLAQVKLKIQAVEVKRNTRPRRGKAEVFFYFRLEEGAEGFVAGRQDLQIADLLNRYEKLLRIRKERGNGYEDRS